MNLKAVRRVVRLINLEVKGSEPVTEELVRAVVDGGESGHHPTMTNLNWIEKVVGNCWASRIPCFVKQLGASLYTLGDNRPWPNGLPKDSHGGDWNEWPESLRVREFPAVQLPQQNLI
jgi:protein gp37